VTFQPQPRVALFCETFHEINGVALTARQLVAFARRRAHPLLAVQSGERLAQFQEGNITRLELPRGWASFGIEHDLRYDLFLWRHLPHVRRAILEFRPDVIHVTSPGEFGQLGAWIAHTLRIPLVASWHTNLHQFAGRRLQKLLSFLPKKPLEYLRKQAERASLAAMVRFYRFARVTLAPTARQVRWLGKATRRPSFLMPRGVDCHQFHPGKRTIRDGALRLGYVGRITPEKGVRLFVEIEQALLAAGYRDFSMVFVGEGSEREWLQRNLKHATFTGILRGELLAEAYANMDLFVFPSRTDTFGNVVQEAAASAVPAVVSSEGGPRHLVTHGVTGLVSKDDRDFIANVLELVSHRERLKCMGQAARQKVGPNSWDTAFEMTYQAYRHCQPPNVLPAYPESKLSPNSSLPQRYCA
jgi:phosphatidylinositol alpha 1,6-mannosyltransferase